VATGSRRSLTRRSGRAAIAFVAIVLAGQGGFGALSGPAGRPVAASAAGPAITLEPTTAAAGPAVNEAESPAAAHLAAFDAAPAETPAGAPDAATDAAGLQPTIHYEEAQRHAGDALAFLPGARVAVGFAPRPGDRWPVGGVPPTALPAGIGRSASP